MILCKIAHIPSDAQSALAESRSIRLRTEQFRSAIAFRLSDHVFRDEHFFSLFQPSELSQPSEALSS